MRRLILTIVLLSLLCTIPAVAQITPDQPVMKLDEVGIYTIGYAYRGKPEVRFPLGWTGNFEDHTGIACLPVGEQNGKQALLLHCPWRGGTGITFQEFRFHLPKSKQVRLTGAIAMRADSFGKSDGATFRVFANGQKLLDENRKETDWKPFSFDLTPFAGKDLLLRFETDPGPKDDPSFDFSLWGERTLTLEGVAFQPMPHPVPVPLDLARINTPNENSVVPITGFVGVRTETMQGDEAVLHYKGQDGELTYHWKLPVTPDAPPFGKITLDAHPTNGVVQSLPLAGSALIEWTKEAKPLPAHWQQGPNSLRLMRPYQINGETVTLSVTGHLVGKSLVLDVDCDKPVIRTMDAGGWGPVLRRRQVTTPYYSGQVYYLAHEDLFVNAFLDWTTSNASAHENTRASYGALTDGSRNPLRERIVYSAAWHLAETLPNLPNPPSPFHPEISDKIVLDNWGGRFTDIASDLEKLKDYGITNAIALIHVWQRSGYDNALPAHLPANTEQGGDDGMKSLISTGTRLGYRMALHENYVDYYPNYDLFSEKDIALDSDGKQQLAWYNPGTKIQSFAVKPNAILPLAATQSPRIHERYGTNADYLDVHSAVPPWFHVDYRAGETGAGEFHQVWDTHRALWDYERKTHAGPVFGEGANHFYWSGSLDGVEAQFGVGWPGSQGMTAPLMVDFDLLKIHPLQVNHGMGYYERWWQKAEWGALPPMLVLDQYRMQEVAYGHAGFLGAATWNNVPFAWQEHHLLTPVMARYGNARPVEISYQINGQWVDSTTAAKAGEWRRVRIRYNSGLVITANDTEIPLPVRTVVLPRFGWYASGGGVTAWTGERNGVIADYAETADSVFANARNATYWNNSGLHHLRPEVTGFEQTGPRTFRATYHWQIGEDVAQDYRCFVHFSQPKAGEDGIQFQQDHALPKPTVQWRNGEAVTDGPYEISVPENLPDGDYEWSIGLFVPGGNRVALQGKDDGFGRIRLGILHLSNGGKTVTFLPEAAKGDDKEQWYQAHLNERGQTVDFGTVRTNGSVHIIRQGDEWVLQTLPRDETFVLELSNTRFGIPVQIRSVGGTSDTVQPIRGAAGWWYFPLNHAREYRWPALANEPKAVASRLHLISGSFSTIYPDLRARRICVSPGQSQKRPLVEPADNSARTSASKDDSRSPNR
jgi:hypothetical protein